jgi:hypothetical protein
MDDVIWLFLALIVALVALGAVLAGIGDRRPRVNQEFGSCPSCLTPISLRRVSIFESATLRGRWICPHCGTRMSKPGRRARTAS